MLGIARFARYNSKSQDNYFKELMPGAASAAIHMWYNLASSTGNADATAERDELAKKMNASQVAEAQKLAREWKPVGELVTEPEVTF